MPDDDIEAALRLAGVPRDPNLQTGPFPQWPTLSPMGAHPTYLEQGDRWRASDPTAPDPASPWSMLLALLGARPGSMAGRRNLTGLPQGGLGASSALPEEKFAPSVIGATPNSSWTLSPSAIRSAGASQMGPFDWAPYPNNSNLSPTMHKLLTDMRAHNARARWNVIEGGPPDPLEALRHFDPNANYLPEGDK